MDVTATTLVKPLQVITLLPLLLLISPAATATPVVWTAVLGIMWPNR